MAGASPTIQRRRLGAALRSLREARGLTGEQAAQAVERSASWISRVEGGRIGLRGRDLRDLLDLYRVTETAQRGELLALADEGRERGWWSAYRDSIPEPYATLIGLETEANEIYTYESSVVPGLLQTAEYARAIFRDGIPPLTERTIEERVSVRIQRQAILDEHNPVRLHAIFPEVLLRQLIGSLSVMRAQIQRLITLADKPNVEIRIVPDTNHTPIAGISSFVILRFPSPDPDTVYLEGYTGGTFEDPSHLEVYSDLFQRIIARSYGPEKSIELLREALTRSNQRM